MPRNNSPPPALGSLIVDKSKPTIITDFHYRGFHFPQLEPTEYPKYVTCLGYPPTIAKDAQEEAELYNRTPFVEPKPKAKIINSNPIQIQNGIQLNPPQARIPPTVPAAPWWKRVWRQFWPFLEALSA